MTEKEKIHRQSPAYVIVFCYKCYRNSIFFLSSLYYYSSILALLGPFSFHGSTIACFLTSFPNFCYVYCLFYHNAHHISIFLSPICLARKKLPKIIPSSEMLDLETNGFGIISNLSKTSLFETLFSLLIQSSNNEESLQIVILFSNLFELNLKQSDRTILGIK